MDAPDGMPAACSMRRMDSPKWMLRPCNVISNTTPVITGNRRQVRVPSPAVVHVHERYVGHEERAQQLQHFQRAVEGKKGPGTLMRCTH